MSNLKYDVRGSVGPLGHSLFDNGKPTALVLGSAGFLGRSLTTYLRDVKCCNIVHYDIRYGEEQDLRTARLDLDNIDQIYFLAWDVGGARYLHDPSTQEAQLEWNTSILANTMPQLKAASIPFLFISSQLSAQRSAYGLLKLLGEYWAEIAGGSSVRLSNIYGAQEVQNERTHVVGDFITEAVTQGRITMLTDGREERYFLHIIDACRGIVEAMNTQPKTPSDVAGANLVSVKEIADLIADATHAIIVPGERVSLHPSAPAPNYLPGWTPCIGIVEGIAMTVDLYQDSVLFKQV